MRGAVRPGSGDRDVARAPQRGGDVARLGSCLELGELVEQALLDDLLVLVARAAAPDGLEVVQAPLLEEQGGAVAGAAEVDVDACRTQGVGDGVPLEQAAAVRGGKGVFLDDEAEQRDVGGDGEAVLLLAAGWRGGRGAWVLVESLLLWLVLWLMVMVIMVVLVVLLVILLLVVVLWVVVFRGMVWVVLVVMLGRKMGLRRLGVGGVVRND